MRKVTMKKTDNVGLDTDYTFFTEVPVFSGIVCEQWKSNNTHPELQGRLYLAKIYGIHYSNVVQFNF